MKAKLDTPNSALPQEAQDEINLNNVKQLRDTINKTGINELLLVEQSTETNFTSTTYVQLLNMEGVIVSSGGFVDISFKTSVYIPTNQNIFLQLTVDGNGIVKDFLSVGTSATVIEQVSLSYKAALGAGRHTVKVLAKVDGSTFHISANDSITRLQVVETVL